MARIDAVMSSAGRFDERVVLLAGGVGGAKLAHGLQHCLVPERLSVVVNTADDFRLYGLAISPDLDTVMYTLAGRANPRTGWGVADDTNHVMEAVGALGEVPWFHLGDRDLATHLLRTHWLAEGVRPTVIAHRLSARLGVRSTVLPMTDESVATWVLTDQGELPFQEWFVRRHCEPPAESVRYEGIESARPTAAVLEALLSAQAILIAPSNPYLSIGPILALPHVRQALRGTAVPVVAVSPIVGGRALKGPAGTMLAHMAGEASPTAVGRLYVDFLDGLVIDRVDEALLPQVEALQIRARATNTVMDDEGGRARLAREALSFARSLAASPHRNCDTIGPR